MQPFHTPVNGLKKEVTAPGGGGGTQYNTCTVCAALETPFFHLFKVVPQVLLSSIAAALLILLLVIRSLDTDLSVLGKSPDVPAPQPLHTDRSRLRSLCERVVAVTLWQALDQHQQASPRARAAHRRARWRPWPSFICAHDCVSY